MKIYCVRHGHAELTPDKNGDRPLTARGRQEIERIANYLASRDFHVSHVMHSEKCRARQTAEILAQKIAADTSIQESLLLSPDASIEPLLEELQHWDDHTLLVGHMPCISFLVSKLVVGSDKHDLVCFTPGTVVCLERLEGRRWIISWILRAELITDNPPQ